MELKDITPTPSVPHISLRPKNTRWKKIIAACIICAVVLGAGVYFLPVVLTVVFHGDDALLENNGLALQKVSVANRQNGFLDLEKIEEDSIYIPAAYPTFDLDYTNFATPAAWNQQLVNDVLTRNNSVLDIFATAAGKSYFQFPAYADPANLRANMELYPFNSLRRLARLQAIKALSLERQGKTNEALAEAVKLNRFGRALIAGHNSLIGNLVGISVQRLGSETIVRILQTGKPGKGTLLNVVTAVEEASKNTEGYKDAFRFEYTYVTNSLSEINRDQVVSDLSGSAEEGAPDTLRKYAKYGYYYKENQTKNLYTTFFRQYVDAAGKECGIASSSENRLGPVTWRIIFTENAVGKLMFTAVTGAFDSVLTKQCENDLIANVAKAELGLWLHKIDHGIVPQSLERIAKYMETIPLDPYNKQMLRYDAEKKILYSVGKDKQDKGGGEGAEWWTMENPSFPVSF